MFATQFLNSSNHILILWNTSSCRCFQVLLYQWKLHWFYTGITHYMTLFPGSPTPEHNQDPLDDKKIVWVVRFWRAIHSTTSATHDVTLLHTDLWVFCGQWHHRTKSTKHKVSNVGVNLNSLFMTTDRNETQSIWVISAHQRFFTIY